MAESYTFEIENILYFVKSYIDIVETNVIEISHKRNTLKSRVKQLSLQYKIPKDFVNYISLFLMVTKIIFVENKRWSVNHALKDKLDKPNFLQKNLFKFLFFSRDYNEYYKSSLVFNTVYANNDFEIIRKRNCVVKTVYDLALSEKISFERFYEVIIKRYAYFREYNNPANYYYTKGDVYSNKQFLFIFIFKTLNYLGIINMEKRGKSMMDYFLKLTDSGAELVGEYLLNIQVKNEDMEKNRQIIFPYTLQFNSSNNIGEMMLNRVIPKLDTEFLFNPYFPVSKTTVVSNENDFMGNVRVGIIRKVQAENIPNLLI